MTLFKPFINYYMSQINYWTIGMFMAIESSFIPFPSEIIVPPAAWKAAQGELNIWLVILSGTIGSIIGALFNYYFAYFLGRKIVYAFANTRIAQWCLISEESIHKAEAYFNKYGNMSTFFGRLVPAVRQLISLPAGLSKMNLRNFIFFTAIGAGIWNAILAALGYWLYSQKETLEKYYSEISLAMVFLAIGFVCILIFKALKKRQPAQSQ